MNGAAQRVRAGWAAVLLVVAGLGFARVYAGPLPVLLVVVAVVVPLLVVWAGERLGLGALTPALLVVVVAAGVAWLVLGRSLTDALPRLLTSPRPLPTTATLSAPVVVLVALVAALVAASVFSTPGSAGRVAGLLAPVAGAASLYVASALLSAGTADPHGVVAACLLVVVVAGWSSPVVRATGLPWRPAAVVPVLVAGVLALGAGTVIGTDGFDPARHVRPPTVRLVAASPLSQLASWQANPRAEIARVRVRGTDRLHLATLTRFTGATWEVDDRYRQVGVPDRPDLPAGRVRARVSAAVQVTRLGGVWLPSAGTATSTTAGGATVDSDDGTLALAGGVHGGLRYDVTAEVDAPSTSRLEVAPPATAVPARYLDLPGAPAAFATYAREAVRGASSPLEEAVALEHAVSTGRTVSATAPTGAGYSRLSTFLFAGRGVPGAGTGTSEQFAAAFGVLAREVGLPTRLVVGFDVPRPGADGTSVVHGGDAALWPEVYFTGAGWVPFSPTPGGDGGAAGDVRDSVLQKVAANASRTVAPPPIKAGRPVRGAAPTTPHASARAVHHSGGLPGWAWVLLVAAAVVVGLAVLLAALRRVRSARHRRAGALGAWAEFQDLLVLLGRPPRRDATAPDLAAAFDAGHPGSGARAVTLAGAADRAGFGPDPVGDQPELWRDLRVLRRRARASVPVARRVLWPVDPRPLLRR